MGLTCSHDAWYGSYSAFGQWRFEIARAAGLPPLSLMEGFYQKRSYSDPRNAMEALGRFLPIRWECLKPSPLHILLNHSDCDGEIESKDCGAIADELEKLLQKIEEGWRLETEQFIDGLRSAAKSGQSLLFR